MKSFSGYMNADGIFVGRTMTDMSSISDKQEISFLEAMTYDFLYLDTSKCAVTWITLNTLFEHHGFVIDLVDNPTVVWKNKKFKKPRKSKVPYNKAKEAMEKFFS